MRETEIYLVMRIAAIVASALLFVLLLRLTKQHSGTKVLKAWREFAGLLREREKDSSWHQRTMLWMERNGAEFHYGKWITPANYLTLRIVLAALGLLSLSAFSVGYGILAAVFLFFLPGWLLVYLNKQDNMKLLPEIKLMYHALEIQIKAGVYVTDALAECYGSVKEPRLQKALLDLAGDIVVKADIYQALERFQGRFDNRYIDSLCITLLQACESGQAVELLNDIGEQLKDMEAAVMKRRKSSLDRSITFYQLGVLLAVLIVVIYACVSHMFSAAMQF